MWDHIILLLQGEATFLIYISLVDIMPELNKNDTANYTKVLNLFRLNLHFI